jgi:nucleoside-diphosphate-sugar epimerase
VDGLDLVTGATGFIGGHLVRRLLTNGRAVRALSRPGSEEKLDRETRSRIDIVPGDLNDGESLARATRGISRVFHCAGEVSDWGPVDRFTATNVRGARLLLEAARASRVERFVHMSSFVVFGVPSPPRIDDASPYGAGRDAYTTTKIEGEKLVFACHAEKGLAATILRPTVVYGPGSTWLEEPLRMMRRGAFFLIGHGAGTCHPCYIENLLDAALLVAEDPRAVGQAYLVADDDPVSFREYFEAVASLHDGKKGYRSIPTRVARAIAFCLESVARVTRSAGRPLLTSTAIDLVTTPSRLSIRKIREELGFSPRYSLRSAFEEMRQRRQA